VTKTEITSEPDLVVVGGGPGGYVAALRAAALGLRTVLVEKERPGGVCLNWGCIPTKAMLRSAEVFDLVRHASEYGVAAENPTLDYPAVLARKDRVVQGLTDGVAQLLRSAGVEVVPGHARMSGPGSLDVFAVGDSPLGTGGPRYLAPPLLASPSTQIADAQPIMSLRAPHVILATGSVPLELRIEGSDDPRVVTSDGAFLLTSVPRRVLVVGGSAVGVEWASMLHAFGAEVTVVELTNRLVPAEDEEVSALLERSLVRRGITVRTSTTVAGFADRGGDLEVRLTDADGPIEDPVRVDVTIVGVGRRPNVAALGLEHLGLEFDERGFVAVDEHLTTSLPGHYAIGDVTGKAMLAHVASHQGMVAVAGIAGASNAAMSYDAIPAVTICEPEIASVGRTETQAITDGHDVVVGRFPFAASGRAQTMGSTEGFVKIVADRHHGEILGVHIIGPNAGELIPEGVLAIGLEATLETLADAIHAHPTLAEATSEATMAALGLPVHLPKGGTRRTATRRPPTARSPVSSSASGELGAQQ
jgi:dihydrolipoamide dehydrogenase